MRLMCTLLCLSFRCVKMLYEHRNLANLLVNKITSDGNTDQAETASASTELNLTGDREFLTTESANEALAPLMSEGSSITKVH